MLYFLKHSLFIFALVLAITSSCKKEETPKHINYDEQSKLDESIILTYLENNNIEAIKDSSGLYYSIILEGNGNYPNLNSTIEFKYKGYYTTGDIFGETNDTSISYPLDTLIPGWQIGVPLISEGGKIILYVPTALAYGQNDSSGIPGNSILIFEIELIGVIKESTPKNSGQTL